MVDFSELIKQWGYLAVFLGSIVEGESVLITASALAAFDYLSIYKVFLVAFLTTVFVDQILFLIGYKTGTDWLVNKFPKLNKARNKVFSLLNRMDIFFIFAFRFIYGIRTVSPLIIGSAKIKPLRFVYLNILSGLCWAFVGCFLGYTISDFVVDGKFDTMPAVIAITIIIIIIGIGIGLFIK
ncbi:MAG: VTT domain-containing protein, partial [Holosporales bacterium]|nr:VTT domain-containing protein [Holosporales bacterium]